VNQVITTITWFEQLRIFSFLARDSRHTEWLARYVLSPVRLSVRLYVTRVDQPKTVEVGIMNFHHTVVPSLQFCRVSFIPKF